MMELTKILKFEKNGEVKEILLVIVLGDIKHNSVTLDYTIQNKEKETIHTGKRTINVKKGMFYRTIKAIIFEMQTFLKEVEEFENWDGDLNSLLQ